MPTPDSAVLLIYLKERNCCIMKNWVVKESGFQKDYVRKYESIMSMGNGYMGVRAATEESYDRAIRYTLVAGTFDAKEDEDTTELPNAADTTALFVTMDGIPLYLTQENTENLSSPPIWSVHNEI